MSDSGLKSCASASLAVATLACVQGLPTNAASAFAARLTTAAMPPKARRTAFTVSLPASSSMAKPAHSAEMSQSKRLLIL